MDIWPNGQLLKKGVLAILTLLFTSCAVTGRTENVDVTVNVTHIGGDLTPVQLGEMLRSPKVRVRASYYPSSNIPGVTAHWSRCGFLMLPCLEPEEQTVELPGDQITRTPTQVSFSIPPQAGNASYQLQFIEIDLPAPYQLDNPGQIYSVVFDLSINCHGCLAKPRRFLQQDRAGTFELGGRLDVTGATFGIGSAVP
ncbi:hypothetical protein [Trinickia dinghuensis]|uniref:Uncharacterized protein n=1 Tax=Trinickia dinghuensis TaxID=2291023 RepID=A0A3D8K2V9_9BURK|nr:hypothetical protein [Trinickia dinghuensis]RDU98901.1 hypothetical protein DWV00_11660 [Trinickia dinghuensis]